MATLYRTYRPKTFNDVIGQNHVKVTLGNEIASDAVAHAYIFSGPRGVGKTTVARIFAKALNCEKRKKTSAEPCNTCPSCTDIMAGKDIDLVEIDAASHTGVDNVRENIIELARFTPAQRKYKVFIIDEVHMLSTAAFNALLKTLEEPPAHVIFIMATTEVHKVPETILSRCQRFDFRRIPAADLIERLKGILTQEKVRVDDDVLQSIVRLSDGSARDAESLLGQILTLGGKTITADMASVVLPRSNMDAAAAFVEYCTRRNVQGALTVLHTAEEEGVDLVQFNRDVIELLRVGLLRRVVQGLDDRTGSDIDPALVERIDAAVIGNTIQELVSMTALFLKVERDVKLADIPTLPIELAIVELCVPSAQGERGASEPPGPPPSSGAAASAGPTAPSDSGKAKQKKKEQPTARKDSPALAAVQQQWASIIQQIRADNQSLAMTLRVCEPIALEETTLTVRCDYAFHADRLRASENRAIVEDALTQALGKPLTITMIVERAVVPPNLAERPITPMPALKQAETKDTATATKEPDAFLDQILQTFGGKVSG